MTTSPDSISYPVQNYGLLGPLPAYVINIQDVPGADPTGNDDSTLALNDALASLPDAGGVLELAPGIYKFSDRLVVKSNTVIQGSGTLMAAPPIEWVGSPVYLAVVNENHLASVITDENITFRGITLDMSAHGTSGVAIHGFYMRKARHIIIENVIVLGGSSSIALLGCDDTLELGNRLYNFTNCGSDHWDSPSNGRLIGCHLECDSSAQMVNWNPEGTTPPSTGQVAAGFTMVGNTLVSHRSQTDPCLIESLSAGNFVRNVTVTGNTFKNVWTLFRGGVDGVVCSGNVYSDFASASPAIVFQNNHGDDPGAFNVSNNEIRDAFTSALNLGVIVAEGDSGVVSGNSIQGTAYLSDAIYRGSTACQVIANNVEDLTKAVSNRLRRGIILPNGFENFYAWTDASGTVPRMKLQGDDFWVFEGTDAAGAARVLEYILMRNSDSEFVRTVGTQFIGRTRWAPAAAVAAAGASLAFATVLANNYNQVTSCTAGVNDGVKLTILIGYPQTVTNATATAVNVYPSSGTGTIDGGGAGVAVTIAAGKTKTFFQYVTDNYRTIGEF